MQDTGNIRYRSRIYPATVERWPLRRSIVRSRALWARFFDGIETRPGSAKRNWRLWPGWTGSNTSPWKAAKATPRGIRSRTQHFRCFASSRRIRHSRAGPSPGCLQRRSGLPRLTVGRYRLSRQLRSSLNIRAGEIPCCIALRLWSKHARGRAGTEGRS